MSKGLADGFSVGNRWPLGGKNVGTMVFETGRSARIENYVDASGRLGVAMREWGLVSSVGAPIVVEGRLWGVMVLPSTETLPADTEARLASFAELDVGGADAIALFIQRSSAEIRRLADKCDAQSGSGGGRRIGRPGVVEAVRKGQQVARPIVDRDAPGGDVEHRQDPVADQLDHGVVVELPREGQPDLVDDRQLGVSLPDLCGGPRALGCVVGQ